MASLKKLRLQSQRNLSTGGRGGTVGGTKSKKAVKNSTRSLGSTAALNRGIAGMTSVNSGNLRKGAYGP